MFNIGLNKNLTKYKTIWLVACFYLHLASFPLQPTSWKPDGDSLFVKKRVHQISVDVLH